MAIVCSISRRGPFNKNVRIFAGAAVNCVCACKKKKNEIWLLLLQLISSRFARDEILKTKVRWNHGKKSLSNRMANARLSRSFKNEKRNRKTRNTRAVNEWMNMLRARANRPRMRGLRRRSCSEINKSKTNESINSLLFWMHWFYAGGKERTEALRSNIPGHIHTSNRYNVATN